MNGSNEIKTVNNNDGCHQLMTFTRVIWVDYGGQLRSKVFPKDTRDLEPKLPNCGMVLTLRGGYPTDGTQGPTGEVLLTPPSKSNQQLFNTSLQYPIPWHPRHSFSFAEMFTMEGEKWQHCPIGILNRATSLLHSSYGLSAIVGYELEFALFDLKGNPWPNFDDTMIFMSASMVDVAAKFLDDVYDTLQQMGIKVRVFHAENGPGQFEIVLDHTDVHNAVRHVVLARETVRAIARKHDLHASFAPRYGSEMGNGGHIHFSLDGQHFGSSEEIRIPSTCDTEEDIVVHGIDTIAQQFVQGIVDALPWLMFPINASPVSYDRIVPGHWAGAYQIWGLNNKEAPVRLAQDGSNFEIKVADGISNPFLAMAAIIGAGLTGIKGKVDLSYPVQGDPGSVAQKRGLKLLPTNLMTTMQNFEKECKQNEILAEIFPKDVVQDFIAARKVEPDIENLRKKIIKLF